MAQVAKSVLLVGVTIVMACRTGPSTTYVESSDPAGAVGAFMSAVKANDLAMMGQLWGTESGPMMGRMSQDELDLRLATMRVYLAHDSYEVLAGSGFTTSRSGRRSFRVQITRGTCLHVVPFDLVQSDGRWLVSNVDLEAAGNPARNCPASS